MVRHFGLDQPLLEQFWRYVTGLFSGDVGISLFERRSVVTILCRAPANTVMLFSYALVLSVVLGVPLGSPRRSTGVTRWVERSWRWPLSAMHPNFVLAIVMILIFSFTSTGCRARATRRRCIS